LVDLVQDLPDSAIGLLKLPLPGGFPNTGLLLPVQIHCTFRSIPLL
jgi:hypothetical protein